VFIECLEVVVECLEVVVECLEVVVEYLEALLVPLGHVCECARLIYVIGSDVFVCMCYLGQLI